MKTQSYLFHFVLLYSTFIFLLLKKCFQRPSINDITHFLRFLTPPSPLILVTNFTKQTYEVTSPQLLADPSSGPPPKLGTSFMDGHVALPKLSEVFLSQYMLLLQELSGKLCRAQTLELRAVENSRLFLGGIPESFKKHHFQLV